MAAVVTAKEAAAEEVDAVVTAEEAAAKKAVAEKVARKAAAVAVAKLNSVEHFPKTEIELVNHSEVDKHRVQSADASSPTCNVAVTSCLGSQLAPQGNCWNCGEAFSSDHQCDISVKLASSVSLPPVPISKQRPSPSAPIVLKKPVRMLDGSPAFPPRLKGKKT